jgi:hypothetical protein
MYVTTMISGCDSEEPPAASDSPLDPPFRRKEDLFIVPARNPLIPSYAPELAVQDLCSTSAWLQVRKAGASEA